MKYSEYRNNISCVFSFVIVTESTGCSCGIWRPKFNHTTKVDKEKFVVFLHFSQCNYSAYLSSPCLLLWNSWSFSIHSIRYVETRTVNSFCMILSIFLWCLL